MSTTSGQLSVVTTMYYSAPYLEEFYKRIRATLEKITPDYEIIFVNDGSPDGSLEVVKNLFENDRKIRIIDLSRNFGHHKAIMTGLSYAKGDLIFLIDCDLEEEPELLERFYNEIKNSKDVDVIYGVQIKREGNFLKRTCGAMFYSLFNFLSHHNIPRNLMLARIMTRRYVNNLLKFKDKEPLFAGLCSLVGFRQKSVEAYKQSKGATTYTFLKRFNVLANALISFSSRPLVYIFYMGLMILVLSVVFILYLVARKILFGIALEGWASIMVSVWFLGGLIVSTLGMVGLYLSKIFDEVKERPLTVVRKVYERQET